MPTVESKLYRTNPFHFEPLTFDELNWYTEQDIPACISVLDFQRLLAGKDWAILKESLYQGRVFYLKNLGISGGDTETFLNVTRSFFNRPLSDRLKVIHPAITEIWRGHSSFRAYPADDQLLQDRGDAPEVTMNYTWGSYDNVYPDEAFRSVWQAHYLKRVAVTRQLVEIIIEVLDLKQTPAWEKLLGGDALLRYQCYPAIPPHGEYRIGAHVDTSVISVLSQIPADNGYMGLEVWVDNQFIKAPAVKGTAVINFGEILYAFTQGTIKPTRHRVVNPTGDLKHCERTSIPVFFHAAKDLEILCPEVSTYANFYNQQGKTTVSTFLNNAVNAFTSK